MKKTFKLFIVLLTCVFLATGCGQKNVEGTLEEIMTNIYTEFNKLPEDQRPMLENVNILEQETESLDDLIEYTIGTKDIEYKEISRHIFKHKKIFSVFYFILLAYFLYLHVIR